MRLNKTILFKFIPPASFYFLNVATGKNKLPRVARIPFLFLWPSTPLLRLPPLSLPFAPQPPSPRVKACCHRTPGRGDGSAWGFCMEAASGPGESGAMKGPWGRAVPYSCLGISDWDSAQVPQPVFTPVSLRTQPQGSWNHGCLLFPLLQPSPLQPPFQEFTFLFCFNSKYFQHNSGFTKTLTTQRTHVGSV